jgi:hypothetical protein
MRFAPFYIPKVYRRAVTIGRKPLGVDPFSAALIGLVSYSLIEIL